MQGRTHSSNFPFKTSVNTKHYFFPLTGLSVVRGSFVSVLALDITKKGSKYTRVHRRHTRPNSRWFLYQGCILAEELSKGHFQTTTPVFGMKIYNYVRGDGFVSPLMLSPVSEETR